MNMKKYRHAKETRAMLFTFGSGIILSLLFATVTMGCGLFVLGIVFAWGYIRLYGRQSMEHYIPAAQGQVPDLWEMVHGLRRQWHLQNLEIYLNPTRDINAAASDFGSDFIVVNQGLWSRSPGRRTVNS
jgi:Zn-dependent protease with chaperone function